MRKVVQAHPCKLDAVCSQGARAYLVRTLYRAQKHVCLSLFIKGGTQKGSGADVLGWEGPGVCLRWLQHHCVARLNTASAPLLVHQARERGQRQAAL